MKTSELNAGEVQQALKKYSVTEIAARIQVAPKTLYKYCRNNAIQIKKNDNNKFKEDLKNYTIKELSVKYKISRASLYARAKRLGVEYLREKKPCSNQPPQNSKKEPESTGSCWFVSSAKGRIAGHYMTETKAKQLAGELQDKQPFAGWKAINGNEE